MESGQRVSRVLLALLAGLAVGITVGSTGSAIGLKALHAIAPLGTLWINAVRMTVVPLVVGLLFTAIAGAQRSDVIGREAVAAIATFVGILVLAAMVAVLFAPVLIDDMVVTAQMTAAMRSTVASQAEATRAQLAHLPGFSDWLLGLVPGNAVKAAADGAMLPLILFTGLFAFGAREIAPERRAAITGVFSALAAAMLIIVEWTIVVAPIGVFALIAAPAAESGTQIVGAIGYYIITISLVLILFTLVLYPVAGAMGVGVRRFARGVAPAQAVALASSSSLASLPALMRGAEELGVPAQTSGFVLPLAVGAFKAATPISWAVGVLFIAKLYGVTLGAGAVFWVALTAIATSFSIPGVPQGSLLVLSGVLASVGVPAEGVALLIAADTVPDLVGTMTNVTGDMVAMVVVTRATGEEVAA